MHNTECWSSMPICIRLMKMGLVVVVRGIVESHSIGCEQRIETRFYTPNLLLSACKIKDTQLKTLSNDDPSHFFKRIILHAVEKACIKHRHLGHDSPTLFFSCFESKKKLSCKTSISCYMRNISSIIKPIRLYELFFKNRVFRLTTILLSVEKRDF